MKKLLLGLLVALSISGYSQKKTVHVNEIYDDVNSLTVIDTVFEVDSTTTKELKNRFNNWGGTNYRNYKNVKTSETVNQVVIDYITNSFGVLDMYVRITASFKDNKVRLQVTDMGNVYKYIASPGVSIPARLYNVKSYFFKNNQITYKVKPNVFNSKEKQGNGALNYRRDIMSTVISINKGLLINNITSNDDW